MLKLSQKVFLLAISFATIAAYPHNVYNNENTENSELNKCVMKCLDKIQSKDSESDKTKDDTFLHLTNIAKDPESDLTFLNIPYKNKDKSIDILHKATKSLNIDESRTDTPTSDDNSEFYKKEKNENNSSDNLMNKTDLIKIPQDPKINIKNTSDLNSNLHKSDFSSFNIPYQTQDKTIDILKSINEDTNENTSQHVVKTVKKEIINGNKLNQTTEIKNKTSQPTDEILLSDIVNLSQDDIEAGSVMGQNIQVQRSTLNSDVEDVQNSAGSEILRNVSNYCGTLFGKRISFANETTLMEFPWTALLLYNTHTRYHCGGSLITTKYVLTAAHCVAQEFYELSGVRLGEYDITENPDCAPDIAGDNICATTIDADVVKIIIHHAYSQSSFRNDIALLKLDDEYISRSYYPICLSSSDEIFNEKTAIVAGWGATHKAIRSAKLLKAEVPIIDMSKCREIYRHNKFNDTTEMCGSGVNEVDVCKGDSGGALFFNGHANGKDKYFQLGIVSLGVRRCGDERFLPAVFTKITGFYKWIENNIEH
ncbi:uncharacterized protein ACRADG_005177 [Cochliomyia hominivorax]